MPSSQLSIILHNPVAVYFPGQTISGHVLYHTVANKRCRGITIEFRGSGSVAWRERVGTRRRRRIVHRRATEEYYSFVSHLLGGTTDTELAPGNHRYDFSFVLPYHSPNSFEGTFGFVRHFCRATVQVPWGFNKDCYVIYSVNSILDLNVDQALTMPVVRSQTKSVCCLFCRSGPVSFTLNLDRTGFVPGEAIAINAECTNMSSRPCVAKAKIFQNIVYQVGGRRKLETREVAIAQHQEISPGQSDIWSGPGLLVPPVPPSHLNNCSLMTITYIFQFKMEISGALSLSTKVPITIGTIPLRHTFNQLFPAPENETLFPGPSVSAPEVAAPGDPAGSGWKIPNDTPPAYAESPSGYTMPAFPGLEAYPNLPPPSYEESVRGANRGSPEGEIGPEAEVGPEGEAGSEGADGVPNAAVFSGFAPRYVSYGTAFRS